MTRTGAVTGPCVTKRRRPIRKFYDASFEQRVAKQPDNLLAYRHIGATAKAECTVLPTENWVRLSFVLSDLSANKVIKLWGCTVCVVKVLCYKSEGRCFDPSWCHWTFHWHKILPIALWSQTLTEMSTRNISWGWRRPVRKADNLPESCAAVTKSGNLNFPKPSGTLRACKGTALPFTLCLYISSRVVLGIDLRLPGLRFRISLSGMDCRPLCLLCVV